MNLKRRGKKKILFIFLIFIVGFAFFKLQNDSITINEIVLQNEKIPEEFNGYKILHISDLHNKEFGDDQKGILSKIKQIKPNIIVITGDLIDSNNTNISIAMDLIEGAIDIAPILYVSGNHESWSDSYDSLKSQLEGAGVIVLDNEKFEVFRGNASMEFIGLRDPSFSSSDYLYGEVGSEIQQVLKDLVEAKEIDAEEIKANFKILLAHRPELLNVYSESNVDLVFSGHAHGGQFRLPFIGGVIAPDQGLFPQLTEGIHIENNTSMIISRGLGNSIIPIRIFNRPELIVVTLTN